MCAVSSQISMNEHSSKTDKFLRKALDTMFKAVGFQGFDEEFVKQDAWYSRREWTAEQREEFRKWFVSSARKDLKWAKRTAEREFSFFDLMWGWRDMSSNSDNPK